LLGDQFTVLSHGKLTDRDGFSLGSDEARRKSDMIGAFARINSAAEFQSSGLQ
jgi:hypothetical protein